VSAAWIDQLLEAGGCDVFITTIDLDATRPAEAEATTATPQGDPAAPGEEVGITAGCTHIVWCNEPGPAEVVCDTVDQACSCTDRVFECRGDADAVCGTGWHNMRFDPPICGSPGIVQ
jgi:hypothetical protein